MLTLLTLVFKRVLRVGLTFVGLSVIGCLVGYFVLRISLDELPVAVSVPAIGIFGISQMLQLILPRLRFRTSEKMPPILSVALAGLFFSGVGTLDALFSAGIFVRLGLFDLAYPALAVALALGTVFAVILFGLRQTFTRQSLMERSGLFLAQAWDILRFPVRLANGIRLLPRI